MKLTADPDFRIAVAYGKAIERSSGETVLKTHSILFGALIAAAQGVLLDASAIETYAEDIRALAQDDGVDLDQAFLPVVGETMPIEPALKAAIAANADCGLAEFIAAQLEEESDDDDWEDAELVPLAEYGCRPEIKTALRALIEKARSGREPLPHLLLYGGPDEPGEDTLPRIIANELGAGFHRIPGDRIGSVGDLNTILRQLEANDILHIENISQIVPAENFDERLSGRWDERRLPVWEALAVAIELRRDAGISGASDLPPFTLIGTAGEPLDIPEGFRRRFALQIWRPPYSGQPPAPEVDE